MADQPVSGSGIIMLLNKEINPFLITTKLYWVQYKWFSLETFSFQFINIKFIFYGLDLEEKLQKKEIDVEKDQSLDKRL